MTASGFGIDAVMDAALARHARTGEPAELTLAISRARLLQESAPPTTRTRLTLAIASLLIARGQGGTDVADFSAAASEVTPLTEGMVTVDAVEAATALVLLCTALSERRRRTGSQDDEAEVLALTTVEPVPVAQLQAVLVNLRAAALTDRYLRDREPDALREAERILRDVSFDGVDVLLRAALHNNLAVVLREQYERDGVQSVLADALELTSVVIAELPSGPSADSIAAQARCTRCALLAERWRCLSRPDDLDEALELAEQLLDAVTPGAAQFAEVRYTAASLFHDIGVVDRDDEALRQAIEWYREALESMPMETTLAAATVTNIVAAWGDLGELSGDIEELGNGLAMLDELASRFPAEELQAVFAHNRAMLLFVSGVVSDSTADLDEAIELHEYSMRRLPPGGAAHDVAMARAGVARYARYVVLDDPADLVTATRMLASVADRPSTTVFRVDVSTALADLAASVLDWETCADAAERALQAVEVVRGAFDARRWDGWLRRVQGVAALGAYAAAQLGELTRALTLMERGCAVMLAARLQQQENPLGRARETGLAPLVDTYERAAEAVRGQLNLHSGAGRDAVAADASAQDEFDTSVAQFVRSHDELLAAFPELRAAADPDELSGLVQDTGEALSYLVSTPAGGLRLDIVAGCGDADTARVRVVWLPDLDTETVADWVVRLHLGASPEDLEVTPPGVRGAQLGPDGATVHEVVAALHDSLAIGPNAPAPARIVPVGLLGFLPVSNAWAPPGAVQPAIGVAGSGLLHVRAARNAIRAGAVGSAVGAVVNPQPCHWLGEAMPSLSGADREGAMLDEEHHASIVAGRDATRAAVQALLHDERIDTLHIAAHGWTSEDDPDQVVLLLADGADQVADTLVIGDLPGRLRARTVVLACCWLARNSPRLPDEAIGFPSHLIEAGAARVIAPLWPVDDNASTRLMTVFYDSYLSAGSEPSAALAEARTALHRFADSDPRLGPRLRGELHATADAYVLTGS